MSRLAAVLFDLDGVLIDSARAWHRVIARGRERFGYGPISWEEFAPTFGQGVEADAARFFPRQSVSELLRFYRRTLPDEIAAVELCPGALEVLDELGARGLARAVVTNSPRELASRILEQTGIAARIQASAAAGEAAEKPAPDLVLLALARLGVAADRALYVGDSPTDRAAARAAGVRMVGLRTEGDLRIESLAALPALIDRGMKHH